MNEMRELVEAAMPLTSYNSPWNSLIMKNRNMEDV